MKIHISNLYNFNKDDLLVKKQHHFAAAGRSLGFLEMSLFSYPVDTDTAGELSKRIDGIIASLEPEDLVFLQFPTENGLVYEQKLINKIKAYPNTKLILLFHETAFLLESSNGFLSGDYASLCQTADAVILPSQKDVTIFNHLALTNILSMEKAYLPSVFSYDCFSDDNFFVKKILMDAIETVFSVETEAMQISLQPSKDEIHIAYGLHDKTGNYSFWVGASMQSVIENTNASLCFHILHDETLNRNNQQKLTQVALSHNHKIYFHMIETEFFDDIAAQMGPYTIGAIFRIMLPELLTDLSKIIYLDADIFANRDIRELWDTNIANYCLAAVPDADVTNGLVIPLPVSKLDVLSTRYFNSGVLYMNLKRIREKGNMRTLITEYLQKNPKSDLPDQDALNAVYTDETLLLNSVWNTFARPIQSKMDKSFEKKFYHYVGTRCLLYSLTEMDFRYYETVRRTPWKDEAENILRTSLYRCDNRISHYEKLLHQMASHPLKHIFYGEETPAMKNIYKLIPIQEKDYRILVEPDHIPNPILPCLNFSLLCEEKENYIVFVLPQADKDTAIARLESLGLEYEKNYFIIPQLLPAHEGGYM